VSKLVVDWLALDLGVVLNIPMVLVVVIIYIVAQMVTFVMFQIRLASFLVKDQELKLYEQHHTPIANNLRPSQKLKLFQKPI
jgi:hypothetical protein